MNPEQIQREQERVNKLLEGVTEGEWFCYGDEDELRVGVSEDDLTYILAGDICNSQDAALMAESQRLARAYLTLLDAHLALHAQLAQAEERERALRDKLGLLAALEPTHNRWLPGEEGRSGVYADDYKDGGYLWVHEDFQGDVHISINDHPGPNFTTPAIRMAAHCVRRPHVLIAARLLASALAQAGEG